MYGREWPVDELWTDALFGLSLETQDFIASTILELIHGFGMKTPSLCLKDSNTYLKEEKD